MSIKCSLLGHRFDETSVEREREEDGSEVVITVTEFETCSRCGETRVVSENKEVTTMASPAESGPDDGNGAGSDEGSEAGTSATEPEPAEEYDPEGDDAEILDDGGDETDAQAQARGTAPIPDAEADAAAGVAGESGDDDDGDDAVFIDDADDGAADAGRTAGEGTPAADADASGGAAWPGEPDESSDETAGTEETVRGSQSGDRAGGEWPEEPDDDASEGYEDWPEEAKPDRGDDAGPELESSASPTVTVPEGMYKCAECGFTTEVASSSLRAGDFCPECHQGTLVQHEDAADE